MTDTHQRIVSSNIIANCCVADCLACTMVLRRSDNVFSTSSSLDRAATQDLAHTTGEDGNVTWENVISRGSSSKERGDHIEPNDSWLFNKSKLGGGVCGRFSGWTCTCIYFFFLAGAVWIGGQFKGRFVGITTVAKFMAFPIRICLLIVSRRLQKLPLTKSSTHVQNKLQNILALTRTYFSVPCRSPNLLATTCHMCSLSLIFITSHAVNIRIRSNLFMAPCGHLFAAKKQR